MKGYDLTFDEKEFRAEARRAKRRADRHMHIDRAMRIDRMADDMGLSALMPPDAYAQLKNPRAATARIAGALANIIDTELKRQHIGTHKVERGETSTGSEVIRLTIDGMKYNLTLTRARK